MCLFLKIPSPTKYPLLVLLSHNCNANVMHYIGDEQGAFVAQQLQALLQLQVQMKLPPAPAAIGPMHSCYGAEGHNKLIGALTFDF